MESGAGDQNWTYCITDKWSKQLVSNKISLQNYFNLRPYLGNIFLELLQNVLTFKLWFLQHIKNDSSYILELQILVHLYTVLYHYIINLARVWKIETGNTCCRTDGAHFSSTFIYGWAQIQKIELLKKKNKKEKNRRGSFYHLYIIIIYLFFFFLSFFFSVYD